MTCLYEILQTRFQPFLERKEKTYYCEVFFLEEPVVLFYVAIKIEQLPVDGILVEDDEIADIEEISIPVQIMNAGGDFHEEEEFPVYTTIVLQYIINASDMGYDRHLVEVGDFEEYIFVGGVPAHYLYKGGNLVYLLFVEGNNLLLPLFDGFSRKNELKKEHQKDYEYTGCECDKNIYGHRGCGR